MPESTHPGIRLASRSIQGRRVENQDAVRTVRLEDGRLLLALADGMGGHAAGGVASGLSIDTIVSGVERGMDLMSAFHAADEAVRAAALEPGREGMGTTAVAALVSPESYELANVGDSRAYWVDRESAVQLTHDHSFVAERVRDGTLTPDQAERSPVRNLLTRAIGSLEERLVVDTFGPFPLDGPGVLLLSSDGLHGTLAPEQIRETVMAGGDPESTVEALLERAHEGGSRDNISVVIAEVREFFGRG